MENLRPNGQRAKIALALIWIILVLEVVSIISGYFQYRLLDDVANGVAITTEEAEANDNREQVIAIAYILFMIISAVTFIQWFRRAYYNLHQKNIPFGLSYSESAAASSWFIPFINLARPYKIMKELYEVTKNYLFERQLMRTEKLSTKFLGVWWTLWIINKFFGQFVFRYTRDATTVDEYTTATVFGIISNFIGIPLALITIKVITDYASIEEMLLETHDEEGSVLTFIEDRTQVPTGQ